MPHEEYQAFAREAAREAEGEIRHFVMGVPENGWRQACEDIATKLAEELEATTALANIDAEAEAVIRRYMPVTTLLARVGATRDDVFAVQLREMLPGVVKSLADDWRELGFTDHDSALSTLDTARKAIGMMEATDMVEQLARHGLDTRAGTDESSAAVELGKIHVPQEGDDIVLRRGNAGFVALIGVMLLYKIAEINDAAYHFVQNTPNAKPIGEREDFLTLHELLKKRYEEGAARAGNNNPVLIGCMNAALEITQGLRHVQERLVK